MISSEQVKESKEAASTSSWRSGWRFSVSRTKSCLIVAILTAVVVFVRLVYDDGQDTQDVLITQPNLAASHSEKNDPFQNQIKNATAAAAVEATKVLRVNSTKIDLSTASKTGSSQVVDELLASCPNWSRKFAQRFESKCSYWLNEFREWERNVDSDHEVVFWFNPSNPDGGGWGDQLAGFIPSFAKALEQRKSFRFVRANSLEKLFMPCLFTKSSTNWSKAATKNGKMPFPPPNVTKCLGGPGMWDAKDCDRWASQRCREPVDLGEGNKACLPEAVCERFTKMQRPPDSPTSTFGCILRANLEPSSFFLNDIEVNFRFGDKSSLLSLQQIIDIMSKHRVLLIHARTGDASLHDKNHKPDQSRLRLLYCASTVESYLSKNVSVDEQEKQNKFMWFISSDSMEFRKQAIAMFPERVAFLDIRPEHIFNSKLEDLSVAETLADWYLLGLGELLIRDRNSAFSRTSWLMNMNDHTIYMDSCQWNPTKYESNWWTARLNPVCIKALKTSESIPSHHLQPIKAAGKTFPQSWVDYRTGKLM